MGDSVSKTATAQQLRGLQDDAEYLERVSPQSQSQQLRGLQPIPSFYALGITRYQKALGHKYYLKKLHIQHGFRICRTL